MSRERARQLFRYAVGVAVLVALAAWFTRVSGKALDGPCARCTAIVRGPVWAPADPGLRDYLAGLFTGVVTQPELVARIGQDLGIWFEPGAVPEARVSASSSGSGALRLELRGKDPSTLVRLLKELLLRGAARAEVEAKTMLVAEIQRRERELMALVKRRRFEDAVVSKGVEGQGFRRREEDLRAELDGLQLALGTPMEIVRAEPPALTTAPPEPLRRGPLALILALVALLVVLDWALAAWDRRRCRAIIEGGTGLPVVAAIPSFHTALPVRATPYSAAAESFRALRTAIGCAGWRSVAFVAWGHGEGTTTVVANTALSLSMAERRTLAVDGNLRRPALHQIFNLTNETGLTDVLIDVDLPEAVWRSPEAPLDVLVAGPTPPDASTLLEGPRLRRALAEARADGRDVVLVDTPPLAACADAVPLALACEAALLVVRLGAEEPEDVVAAARHLRRAGVALRGIVLNGADPGRAGRAAYLLR